MSDKAQLTLDQTLKQIANELIDQMGVHGEAHVSQEDDVYTVHFDVEETGLLIGYHGETLDSLRMILGQMAFKQSREWLKLSVNVGDYQEERWDQLRRIADQVVEKVRATQRSERMPYLNARERRQIHVYLGDLEGIKTESVGEDEERRLVVFPA